MSHCGICGRWIDDCDTCSLQQICDFMSCTEWSICQQCSKGDFDENS